MKHIHKGSIITAAVAAIWTGTFKAIPYHRPEHHLEVDDVARTFNVILDVAEQTAPSVNTQSDLPHPASRAH